MRSFTGKGPRKVNTQQARGLGQSILALIETNHGRQAHALLASILFEKTPFRILDRIGQSLGMGPTDAVNLFLDEVAAGRTMGGWVVIGSALGQQFERDLADSIRRCREYIVAADAWYATDILGERVPGPALVDHFSRAQALIKPWRADANRWVRRAVGVAVHFWAKRARGAPDLAQEAQRLLSLLEPMLEEGDLDAIKGIGWGLKTLGKHYPDRVTEWLAHQLRQRGRRPRALMLRKATTYLSAAQRARAMGKIS